MGVLHQIFDTLSDSIALIDLIHKKIHQHEAYLASAPFTVASGATVEILIQVPADTEPHVKDYEFVTNVAPGELELFEGTSVSANGSTVETFDMRRDGVITNSGVSLYSGPTIDSDGTRIEFNELIGDKRLGGSATSRAVEWDFNEGETYLLRYTNTSNNEADVGFNMIWYEY